MTLRQIDIIKTMGMAFCEETRISMAIERVKEIIEAAWARKLGATSKQAGIWNCWKERKLLTMKTTI